MDTQEKKIYVAVLLTCLLLVTIILFCAFFTVYIHRRYHVLQKKYLQAEIRAQETERQRLAEELHDDLGAQLTLIKTGLDDVQARTDADREKLHKIGRQVAAALDRTRTLSHHLKPPVLECKGLEAALLYFISTLPEGFAEKIMLQYSVPCKLPQPVLIHTYRILQELLHNAVKHAHCNSLLLQIKEEEQVLRLHYLDDGRGFVPEEGRGQGLYNLRSRTEVLNGRMHLRTAPGQGTQYFFEIPLNPA